MKLVAEAEGDCNPGALPIEEVSGISEEE